jgi:DNA-binding NarL/FixJ family response regulator
VVIADDHAFYRASLARLLRRSGIEVLGEAPNGEVAIRMVEETAPDVVVMDLNMPVLSGVQATRCLNELAPATRVIVLTVSAQESDVIDAILAGASGYLLKDGPPEDVLVGIRAAAAGEPLISPHIAAVLLRRLEEAADVEEDPLRAGFSPKDLDVLRLLAEGHDEEDLARVLAIEPRAVRRHIARLVLKLQAAERIGAAQRAGDGERPCGEGA